MLRMVLSPFFISIHAPREGSDLGGISMTACTCISIHAPREGSDYGGSFDLVRHPISIHAPREGSDHKDTRRWYDELHFNPRSP